MILEMTAWRAERLKTQIMKTEAKKHGLRLVFSIFHISDTIFQGTFMRSFFQRVLLLLYDSGNGSLESGNIEVTDYQNRGQDAWS